MSIIMKKTTETLSACTFTESCKYVSGFLSNINDFNTCCSSYNSFVKWVLNQCAYNIPDPFSVFDQYCKGISIGINYCNINFDKFGIGVKVIKRISKTGIDEILYEYSIVLYKKYDQIKDTPEFKQLLDNGWTITSRILAGSGTISTSVNNPNIYTDTIATNNTSISI